MKLSTMILLGLIILMFAGLVVSNLVLKKRYNTGSAPGKTLMTSYRTETRQ